MAVVKSDVFKIICGKLKMLEFRYRKNKKIELSMKRIPRYTRTQAQDQIRTRYGQLVEQWKKLPESEKQRYNELARRYAISGWNYYVMINMAVQPLIFDNDGGGAWYRYVNIPITTIPAEYAQYQIVFNGDTIEVYSADGTLKTSGTGMLDFWNNVKSTGEDIRVFDENKNQLYFFVENWDYANQQAIIWVNLPANAQELNIAYGNPNALQSAYHDGNQVFEEFTDFETQTLEGWTIDVGNYSINSIAAYHGGYGLDLPDAATTQTVTKTLSKTLGRDIVIEFAIQNYENAGQASHNFYIVDNNDNGYGIGFVFATTVESRIFRRDAGTDTQIGYVTGGGNLAYDTWYYAKITIKSDGTIIMSDGKGEGTVNDTTYSTFTMLKLMRYRQTYFDYIRVYKLADPAAFGTPTIITLQ